MRKATAALRAEIEESPERLSLSALNKAVVQLLDNQAMLMARLGELESRLESLESAPAPARVREDAASPSVSVKVTPSQRNGRVSGAASGSVTGSVEAESGSAAEAEESALRGLLETMGADDGGAEPEGEASEGAVSASAAASQESVGAELSAVNTVQARVAIRAFDKRDNDFERGLDLLNRWVGGGPGSPGMPFQIRRKQDLAYINVTGLSREKITEREAQVSQFLGYSKRLGRLSYEGLHGEVWLYTR